MLSNETNRLCHRKNTKSKRRSDCPISPVRIESMNQADQMYSYENRAAPRSPFHANSNSPNTTQDIYNKSLEKSMYSVPPLKRYRRNKNVPDTDAQVKGHRRRSTNSGSSKIQSQRHQSPLSYGSSRSSSTILLNPENSLFRNYPGQNISPLSSFDDKSFSYSRKRRGAVNHATPQDAGYGHLSPVRVCNTKEETYHVFRRTKQSHELTGSNNMRREHEIYIPKSMKLDKMTEQDLIVKGQDVLRKLAFDFEHPIPKTVEKEEPNGIFGFFTQFFHKSKSPFETNTNKLSAKNEMQSLEYLDQGKENVFQANKSITPNYNDGRKCVRKASDTDICQKSYNYSGSYDGEENENGFIKSVKKKHRRSASDGSGSLIQAVLSMDPSAVSGDDARNSFEIYSSNSKNDDLERPTSMRLPNQLDAAVVESLQDIVRLNLNRARTASVSNLSCLNSLSSTDSSIDSFLTLDSSDLSLDSFDRTIEGARPRSHSVYSKSTFDETSVVSLSNRTSTSAPQLLGWQETPEINELYSNDPISTRFIPELKLKNTKSTTRTSSCSNSSQGSKVEYSSNSISNDDEMSPDQNRLQRNSSICCMCGPITQNHLESCTEESAAEKTCDLIEENSPKQSNADQFTNNIFDETQYHLRPTSIPERPPLSSPTNNFAFNFDFPFAHQPARPHLLSDHSSYVSSCSSEDFNKLSDDALSLSSNSSDNTDEIPTHIYDSCPKFDKEAHHKENLDSDEMQAVNEKLDSYGTSPNTESICNDVFHDKEDGKADHNAQNDNVNADDLDSLDVQKELKSDQAPSQSTGSDAGSLARNRDNSFLGSESSLSNMNLLTYSISASSPDRDSLGNTIGTISPMVGLGHLRSFSQNSSDSCYLFCKSPVSKASSRSGNSDILKAMKFQNIPNNSHRRYRSLDVRFCSNEFKGVIPNLSKAHRRGLSDTSILMKSHKKRRHKRSGSGGLSSSQTIHEKEVTNGFKPIEILFREEVKGKECISLQNEYQNNDVLEGIEEQHPAKGESSVRKKLTNQGKSEETQELSPLARNNFIVDYGSPSDSLVLKKELDFCGCDEKISTPSISSKLSGMGHSLNSSPIMRTQTKGLSSGEDCKKRNGFSRTKDLLMLPNDDATISKEVLVDTLPSQFTVKRMLNCFTLDQLSLCFSVIAFLSVAMRQSSLSYTSSIKNQSSIYQTSLLHVPFFLVILTRKISWSLSYLYMNELISKWTITSNDLQPYLLENAFIGFFGIVWAMGLVKLWKIPSFLETLEKREQEIFSLCVLLYCFNSAFLVHTKFMSEMSSSFKSFSYTISSTFAITGIAKINRSFPSQIYVFTCLSLLLGLRIPTVSAINWLEPSSYIFVFLSVCLGPLLRRNSALMTWVHGERNSVIKKRILIFTCLVCGCYGAWSLLSNQLAPGSMVRNAIKNEIVTILKQVIEKVEGDHSCETSTDVIEFPAAVMEIGQSR